MCMCVFVCLSVDVSPRGGSFFKTHLCLLRLSFLLRLNLLLTTSHACVLCMYVACVCERLFVGVIFLPGTTNYND